LAVSALSDFPGFATARLAVRPLADADLDDLFAVNGDAEVTRFLPYAAWQSAADGQAWLRRMRGLEHDGVARQLVLAHEGGPVVGTLLLFHFDAASARAEVGYVLGRAWWGRGLMREALEGACSACFGNLGLRRLEAYVDRDNAASNALLRRVGFVHEGTLRQRTVAHGTARDMQVWGLLSGEWPTA
jgi:[ribosomal protein S5]-alanine N-acetyltransferase